MEGINTANTAFQNSLIKNCQYIYNINFFKRQKDNNLILIGKKQYTIEDFIWIQISKIN